MKTLNLLLFFSLTSAILVAQTENKKATVRIKKIENINGVEKITDTTYTTDAADIRLSEDNVNITEWTENDGKKKKMIVIENEIGSSTESNKDAGKSETIILRAGEQGALKTHEPTIVIEDFRGHNTQTIIRKKGEKMSPEEEKALEEGIREAIEIKDGNLGTNMEGKTVIIKKLGKCDATKEEIEKAPVAYQVMIVKKIRLTEINEEDKKMLSGKPAAVNDGKLLAEELKFYPNPGSGKFNLRFTLSGKGETEINILDMQGKNVYSEQLGDFTGKYDKEIDISTEPKGVYFVRIKQGDHAQLKKLVLE